MEDSYEFPSEDDAFLANLDLAELDADLGRPIEYEDTTIDHELEDYNSGVSLNTGGLQLNGMSSESSRLTLNTASSTSSERIQNNNLNVSVGKPNSNAGPTTKPSVGGFSFPPGVVSIYTVSTT